MAQTEPPAEPAGPGITASPCFLEQSRSHKIATLVEER